MERSQQAYEKELKTLESCGGYLKKSVKEKKEKPIPRLSKVWLKASDFVKKRDFKAAYNLILE